MKIKYYVLKLINAVYLLVLPTNSMPSEDDVYLLATALYCTDHQHRVFIINGPLPAAVEGIIKSDMQSRINPKANVKVVPFLRNNNITLEQSDSKSILEKFKSYRDVLKADLSKVASRKMLKSLWYYVIQERTKHHESKTQNPNEMTTTEETKISTTPKRQSSPDDYVPNDIYYAVEKRCANWADGCESKSPSILEMPGKYFKPPVGYKMPPVKSRWDR